MRRSTLLRIDGTGDRYIELVEDGIVLRGGSVDCTLPWWSIVSVKDGGGVMFEQIEIDVASTNLR